MVADVYGIPMTRAAPASLLQAVDFSSLFIPSITPNAAQSLVNSGVGLAVIGFDTSAASAQVRAALVGAGDLWDAYRFLYGSEDPAAQVANVVAAIHAAPEPLPGYLHLDIEPIWNADGTIAQPPPTIAQIEAAMDAVEASDILPSGTLVKPSIYSSPSIWQQWYPGYTGPADRGWFAWIAAWGRSPDPASAPLFGGFTREQVIGIQYAGSSASAIGVVDLSTFVGRTPPTQVPPPSPIDPGSALMRIRAGQALRQQAQALDAQADVNFEMAAEDIQP